jgi:hypothetical protein
MLASAAKTVFTFGGKYIRIPKEYLDIAAIYIFYSCFLFWFWRLHNARSIDFAKLVLAFSIFKRPNLWVLIVFPLLIFLRGLIPVLNALTGFLSHQHSGVVHFVQPNLFLLFIQLGIVLVISPFVEEVVFRGILLHRISMMLGVSPAIVATSLIFGLMHMAPITSSVFGVVMCLVYIRTGSLAVVVYCHMLNNMIAAFFAFHSDLLSKAVERQLFGNLGLLLSAGIIGNCIFRLWPRKHVKNMGSETSSQPPTGCCLK